MLQVSNKVEYGINLMLYLSQSGKRLSLSYVARKTKMPYSFLNQIARKLKHAGLIQSKEGKGGGYSLSLDPAKISVGKIIRSLDEPICMAQCFCGKGCNCPLNKGHDCQMKKVWSRIKKNVENELDNVFLSDLINSK